MTIADKLWKTFNRALGQYQLISDDDHILVGLSGGKDSLTLLYALNALMLIYLLIKLFWHYL